MNPTRKPRDPRPVAGTGAHVTTFYSYKGGVGRSLLLANVGWLLAERRRVLLWDLDVEAPGLHRIPALKPAEVRRGFLEWLNEWAEGEPESADLTARRVKELRGLVRPVPGRSNLAILPAFGEGADFARLYAEGPWRRLLVEEPVLGLDLFHGVLAVLAEDRDHVLIDSRTGVTDIGGLLAALLPHATVLVGGYGHQSLHGLLHVKAALEPAAKLGGMPPRDRLGVGAALQLLHAVSPVPEDTEEAAERKRVWTEVFGAVEPVVVPFDRRLLWNESLLAATDPACAPALAYAEVAKRIGRLRDQLLADAEAAEIADARYPEEIEDGPGRKAALGKGDARSSRRGLTFEQRVARLLELHGYSVEPEQILGGSRVDLVARIRYGLEEQCWWVECKDHQRPVGKEVLEKLNGWVSGDEGRRQRARAMVVARGFSPAALSYAGDHPEMQAYTVDDLERRLYDPRPALQSLVTAFENGPLGRTYVRQRVLLEQRAEEDARADLLKHAHAWARGEGPRLWLLLGDYGTGKTAFFQRFAYELAQRALEDPDAPFPIAIDLKKTPNTTSAETLLFEYLRSANPNFRGGPEVLLHLLVSGRCVLLLDAFDEMGVAAAGRSVEEQFRELARLAGEEPLDPRRGGRVLITCRTHFFRDQQQVKDTAAGRPAGLVAVEDSALGRVARRFNAEIDELDLFDDRQIEEFIANHLEKPGEVERAREFIRETYDLPTLAPRPVLLEMIVKRLPALWREAAAGTKLTSASLYEIYTREWLEDQSGRSLQTAPQLRYKLLSLLAASLWHREDRQLHYRDLLAEVRRLALHFPALDPDRVDIELRTAAFLVRSPSGYYQFSHKSFLEYFLARHLWQELAGDPATSVAALDLPALGPEVAEFFWQMPEPGAERRRAALAGLLTQPYRPRVSENALRLGVWSHQKQGRRFRIERAQLAGAQLRRADLHGVELPNADLSGAVLDEAQVQNALLFGARLDSVRASRIRASGATLSEASLSGAWLPSADLSRAILRNAVLEDAVLADAVLDDADLSHVRATRASFIGARGHHTSFEHARLDSARFSSVVLTSARLGAARFDGAVTQDWLLSDCDGEPAGVRCRRLDDLKGRVGSGAGHGGWVWSVALSADGSVVASGGDDGSVRLCDGSSGAERAILFARQGGVLSVALSTDGLVVASGGDDDTVRVWDAASGAERAVLRGHQGSVWSVALSADGLVVASGGADGTVRVWDLSTGLGRVLSGHDGRVSSVALSADGTAVASGGDDGSVRLWDVSTATERAVFSGHRGRVLSVASSGNATVIASGGADGTVRLWGPLNKAVPTVLQGHKGGVWSVALSADGTGVASGGDDGRVRLWDASSGTERAALSGHRDWIRAVGLSADGQLAASGGADGSVRLWDVARGVERAVLTGRSRIWSVALSANGRVMASGGDEGALRLWDSGRGAETATLSGHSHAGVWSVAVSADGTAVAAGGDDGLVHLWDVPSGVKRMVLSGHSGGVLSVAVSGDGQLVASGGVDGGVRVWNASSGAQVAVLSGHRDWIRSVAVSADGTLVASGGVDGTVRLWHASSGAERLVLSIHAGRVLSVALSANGEVVAAAGDDGRIRLWDVSTGAQRAVLSGHPGRTPSVALSTDGAVVVSGGDDGPVRVWDGVGGAERTVLSGHLGSVLSVALSADGQTVASAGADGTVRLWDWPSRVERARFSADSGFAVISVVGGWFTGSPKALPTDLGLLRLHLDWGSPGSYRVMPLGGLAHLLHRPDYVSAVIAGDDPPPPPPIWTSS